MDWTKSSRKVLRKHKSNDYSPDDQLDWKGLRRYVGDSEDPVITTFLTNDEQYAKYSLILDSTLTRFVYFYDSPGIQPSVRVASRGKHQNWDLKLKFHLVQFIMVHGQIDKGSHFKICYFLHLQGIQYLLRTF